MTKTTTSMRQLQAIISFPLTLLLFLTVTSASDEKSTVENEKVTAVEPAGEASTDKVQSDSGKCKTEVDRNICNEVNKALTFYYHISNHVPVGYYERNYEMSRLTENIEAARQRTIDESGHPDSISIYTAFINFVKYKEKTELLFNRQDYDEADTNRKMAFKYHDEIIEFCKPCVEVLK